MLRRNNEAEMGELLKRLQEEIKRVETASDDAAVVSTTKGAKRKDQAVAPKSAGPSKKIRRK